jgi:hypothetical protein
MNKINMKGLALALGLTWGIYVLCLGWISCTGWGIGMVKIISSLYLGYSSSFFGAILGGIWAFFDGAVAGIIIAWIYNRVSKKK